MAGDSQADVELDGEQAGPDHFLTRTVTAMVRPADGHSATARWSQGCTERCTGRCLPDAETCAVMWTPRTTPIVLQRCDAESARNGEIRCDSTPGAVTRRMTSGDRCTQDHS